MIKSIFVFGVGVFLGYSLVQGLAYFQQHYLWALFYH